MANILVIDPSRSMRNTLKERLEYEGHAVEVAEDTISGMTVYANRHFDLLLCGQPDSPLRTSTPWIRLSHDSSPESAVRSETVLLDRSSVSSFCRLMASSMSFVSAESMVKMGMARRAMR